jgi:hypothetical protein
MRSSFVTTVLCAVTSLLSTVCCAQTVTHLQSTSQGFLIVQVSINGSAPHPFFLDTGSNKTLVRNELLESLGLALGDQVPAHSATGITYVHQTRVLSVAVAGLAVHDIQVEGIDAGQVSTSGVPVEGVLGEDFLNHFDILIDNHAKTLTLDASPELSHSLAGEHLPLSFSGSRNEISTGNRLIFDLKLPSSNETKHFLLDSGADHILFFPTKPLLFQARSLPNRTLQTFGGSGRCHSDSVPIKIGSDTLPDEKLAFCEGMRGNTDVDGILPTSTFKRLFISHAGAYAIANPRQQKHAPKTPSTLLAGNE